MSDLPDPFIAACIQTNSGPDIDPNLEMVGPMLDEAAAKGAKLIMTPENTCALVHGRDRTLERAEFETGHRALEFFKKKSQELDAWILLGSLLIKQDDKAANRSFLFRPDGNIIARYDKLHLFNVQIDEEHTYRETDTINPGGDAIVADTDYGSIGMSICYDVRFPYLYRSMAHAHAQILSVPSAFTVPTGRAHWEILLRARAIETGCFVMAPAQCGTHDGGRKTYGHSMIIGPWGEILAQAGDHPDIITAEIDLSLAERAHKMLPSIFHDHDYDLQHIEHHVKPAY